MRVAAFLRICVYTWFVALVIAIIAILSVVAIVVLDIPLPFLDN